MQAFSVNNKMFDQLGHFDRLALEAEARKTRERKLDEQRRHKNKLQRQLADHLRTVRAKREAEGSGVLNTTTSVRFTYADIVRVGQRMIAKQYKQQRLQTPLEPTVVYRRCWRQKRRLW